jgi:AraC-like DNA-binding protein
VTISQGSGLLQFSEARHKVGPGSVFILPPVCWHRYRPDPEIGWVEDWIELRGTTLEAWIAKGLLKPGVTQISLESPSWGWLKEIHGLCRAHGPGFRPAVAGLAMAYLAQVLAGEDSSKTSDIILRARELLLTGVDVDEVAKQLGISYLTLYRHFKKTTGLSPKEYAMKIRLAQAEDLISGSDMSIKQVAKRLGFHSASHLSLEYKKAHGVAPQMTRKASAENSGPNDIFSWRPEAL